jgi:hypothetical protein
MDLIVVHGLDSLFIWQFWFCGIPFYQVNIKRRNYFSHNFFSSLSMRGARIFFSIFTKGLHFSWPCLFYVKWFVRNSNQKKSRWFYYGLSWGRFVCFAWKNIIVKSKEIYKQILFFSKFVMCHMWASLKEFNMKWW